MARITLVVIPEGKASSRQYTVSQWFLKSLALLAFSLTGALGYFALDYWDLLHVRQEYLKLSSENEGLKGEARLLLSNLEDVKLSLRRVQDYSEKLGEITNVKVRKVSKMTGIGPLTSEEYSIAKERAAREMPEANYVPLGVNMDKLIFKPVFDRMNAIGQEAGKSAIELQQLLSNLTQKKDLLASIPSISPVNGWITSGFGERISPFTGLRTLHNGIDVAAPVGTPVYAPAEGVVIFTGKKSGFGNFIMIAHNYGVVSAYGHNAENLVQIGQKIHRGDQIATVGMTGRTTGPHLHYEILLNGRNSDPTKFILDMTD